MRRTINLNRPNSIKKLISELQQYKIDLNAKCEEFCARLTDIGIQKADANAIYLNDLGNIKSFVYFYKKLDPQQYGCNAMLIGSDVFEITKSWFTKEGYKSAEVSALLMAEFGSGNMANTKNMNILAKPVKAGRKTFPKQTHAEQPYWAWFDGRQWHTNCGIRPTTPMYKAWLEMHDNIDRIGKEVFGRL